MIDELIAGIVLFKNFILLTLAAGIIGSLLAVIGTRKFSWNGRARGVYGFLINRSDREAVCFAVSLLGFLFVLSSVIFRVEMELPHLVFLGGKSSRRRRRTRILKGSSEQHPDLCRPAGRKCPERVPEGDEV